MTHHTWDAIVVGGGAAGYYGAITCAEAIRDSGRKAPARVLILERASRPDVGQLRTLSQSELPQAAASLRKVAPLYN